MIPKERKRLIVLAFLIASAAVLTARERHRSAARQRAGRTLE